MRVYCNVMNDTEAIKEKLDIVEIVRSYIPIFPAGKNFKANCPFHREKTASFVISPDRQTWHCFGQCNEGGDVISFVMKYENVEFYEALKALAEKAGIELKRTNPAQEKEFGVLYDINDAAVKFYVGQYESSEEAKKFLAGRGVKEETRDAFDIGFAPNEKDAAALYLINLGFSATDIERAGITFKSDRGTYMDRFRGRIMFPLRNTFGKTVGFSGRILPQYDTENTGKYINSPESSIFNKSRILFGFDMAKAEIRKEQKALVVEGQMDLVMLFQDGIRNAVATSGTALTQNHLQTLRKTTDTVIFGFDTDEAGKLATERALDMAHALDFTAWICPVPEGKDAAEFIQKHPGQLKMHIEHGLVSPLDFYFGRFFKEQYANDMKKAARAMLQKALLLFSPIDRNTWIQGISKKSGIPESVLQDELNLIKKPAVRQETAVQTAAAEPEKTRIEKIAERILLLCIGYPSLLLETEQFSTYVPPKTLGLLGKLRNPHTDIPQEQAAELGLLEMKATAENREEDEEKAMQEIRFLLKEMKKEYLKTESDRLRERLRGSEQAGKTEEAEKILRELDEIARLREN